MEPEPAFPEQLKQLFMDESTKSVSQYHLLNRIVLNPQAVIGLLKLPSSLEMLQHVTQLLNEFPLNYVHVACTCDVFSALVESLINNSLPQASDDPERGAKAVALFKLFDGFL